MRIILFQIQIFLKDFLFDEAMGSRLQQRGRGLSGRHLSGWLGWAGIIRDGTKNLGRIKQAANLWDIWRGFP